MISKITGLNDNSIDCLKELQQYGKMTHGTLVLNCLMKNEQLFKKLLANVGIVLDLFDWEFVTVEYKDDNSELVDYYPLPDERYVALAQKTQNGNNNGCLILDHTILMKSLFNMLYKYAVAHDIVEKDYASVMFANGNPIKRSRIREAIPFSQEEIQMLWDNLHQIPFVDMILIEIYSGWRPQELAILKMKDVDIKAGTMRGGLKTEAGKNRIIPIHPLIKPLIADRIREAAALQSKHLFNDVNGQQGTYMTYDKYRSRFDKVMKRLNLKHHPHETRHTFITKAKACGVDEYILKLIVGHAIDDITEKVYTHRTIEQLKAEMEKITK